MKPIGATLVISWSGVLHRMVGGSITPADLQGALFYFGCTREVAFDPRRAQAELGQHGAGYHKVIEVHTALMEVVKAAEKEGRVAWRKRNEPHSYRQLNTLLRYHDLPPIEPPSGNPWINLSEVGRLTPHLPYRILPLSEA